jgi:hypothetical protein
MPDIHVIPPDDSIEHIRSEDCPCGPAKHRARGRWLISHRAQDGRAPGWTAGQAAGIMFQPQPDPMEAALVEWMRVAELRKDGQVTHTGVNLVGNEANARKYARLIADHIKANGPDLAKLTDHLSGTTGAGAHVRAWNFAPHIAEGAIEALARKGLL